MDECKDWVVDFLLLDLTETQMLEIMTAIRALLVPYERTAGGGFYEHRDEPLLARLRRRLRLWRLALRLALI